MKREPISPTSLKLIPILVALFVVVGLIAVLYAVFLFSFPAGPLHPVSTPSITVIAAPSATTLPLPTSPDSPTATPTQVPPGVMGIGAYVQITGTGGDGLRLRTGPGKSNDPLFLGEESEVFLVKDGPKEADGFTWWFLSAPYDEKRKGWAVENYLSVVTGQEAVTPQPTR